MKKLSTLLIFALLCAMSLMFTNCKKPTPDETLSMLVDGVWKGKMDISYTKNGMTYASTSTTVQFWNYANSTTSGTGKWCNTFDNDAPITNLTYNFNWEAKDQVLYLQFETESSHSDTVNKAKVKISNYYIDEAMFLGKVFNMDNSKSTTFELVHTYSPWEWSYYDVYYWDYYPFYPWYDPWYDDWWW